MGRRDAVVQFSGTSAKETFKVLTTPSGKTRDYCMLGPAEANTLQARRISQNALRLLMADFEVLAKMWPFEFKIRPSTQKASVRLLTGMIDPILLSSCFFKFQLSTFLKRAVLKSRKAVQRRVERPSKSLPRVTSNSSVGRLHELPRYGWVDALGRRHLTASTSKSFFSTSQTLDQGASRVKT